jgi:hypothetical protein
MFSHPRGLGRLPTASQRVSSPSYTQARRCQAESAGGIALGRVRAQNMPVQVVLGGIRWGDLPWAHTDCGMHAPNTLQRGATRISARPGPQGSAWQAYSLVAHGCKGICQHTWGHSHKPCMGWDHPSLSMPCTMAFQAPAGVEACHQPLVSPPKPGAPCPLAWCSASGQHYPWLVTLEV